MKGVIIHVGSGVARLPGQPHPTRIEYARDTAKVLYVRENAGAWVPIKEKRENARKHS